MKTIAMGFLMIAGIVLHGGRWIYNAMVEIDRIGQNPYSEYCEPPWPEPCPCPFWEPDCNDS